MCVVKFMNNLDSFDENKVKCRDCGKYFEKPEGMLSNFVDLDKDLKPVGEYYLCALCIDERMLYGVRKSS